MSSDLVVLAWMAWTALAPLLALWALALVLIELRRRTEPPPPVQDWELRAAESALEFALQVAGCRERQRRMERLGNGPHAVTPVDGSVRRK